MTVKKFAGFKFCGPENNPWKYLRCLQKTAKTAKSYATEFYSLQVVKDLLQIDLYLASYLMPNKIGWGKVQPYVRYQHFARGAGADGGHWRTEGGFNYIISGQNANINVTYYADKNGTGADEKNTFQVGFQFQLQLKIKFDL